MKLNRLSLNQFRQFRRPLELADLDDGINLFVGDNETGKSTIVAAVRAAFFERHKSKSVGNLQPWGDSSASPEIDLNFDWQGTPWRLSKRFLKQARCDLHIGPDHFGGDEAEEKLAELLGYQFAGRGASKAEHHGIPGLLWVEQGSVQDIQDPVKHAGEHLQSALGSSLGEVASSSGDELIAQVEQQYDELLTKTGKPRGDYKKTLQQRDDHRIRLNDLRQQVEAYEQQVDELGRLRRQQQEIDAAEPWQAQRVQAKQAETRLAEVRGWQQRQQADEKDLAACRDNQQLYRQQLKDFTADGKRLEGRAAEKQAVQAAFDSCQARKPALDKQLSEAQAAYEQAQTVWDRARSQALLSRVQNEHELVNKSLEAQKRNLDDAKVLQTQLVLLREQQQATVIDGKALARLKKLESKLVELKIQQEALATRLQYDLKHAKNIVVGDEAVTGQGECLLLDATTVAIPDVGTLQLKPGGTDAADLRRRQQQQQAKRNDLLRELAINSLEEGEQRAAEDKKLGEQIANRSARLEGLAPQGVDDLAAHYHLAERQLVQLVAKLAEYPAADSECPDEKKAEQTLSAAQGNLKAMENAVGEYNSDFGIARQALTTANREYDKLHAELQAPDRKQRQEQANNALVDLNAREARFKSELAQRQQQIDAAQPEALAQDIERCNKSAAAMEQEANKRQLTINELQVRLQTLGAQELGEQYETLEQETQRLQRRCDELQRRASALVLLLHVLREKRQIVTRQLQAPLQKHLNHYLGLLFPQASLSVDENLMPDTLMRPSSSGEERGDVEDLSYGAREQMGLISRLAYADLLREAGKPTLIVLDDALVHCDASRLDHMKRILYDAAQRHQVLLFSCHPDNWRDLGVAPRDLQAIKNSAG